MITLKLISEKFNASHRYRDAVRESSQFSDHELCDIGILAATSKTSCAAPVRAEPLVVGAVNVNSDQLGRAPLRLVLHRHEVDAGRQLRIRIRALGGLGLLLLHRGRLIVRGDGRLRSSVRSRAATSSWNDVSGSGGATTLMPSTANGPITFPSLSRRPRRHGREQRSRHLRTSLFSL